MKKTTILIEKLIRLANGDVLPACSLKGDWFEQMQEDGILLATTHGSRKPTGRTRRTTGGVLPIA